MLYRDEFLGGQMEEMVILDFTIGWRVWCTQKYNSVKDVIRHPRKAGLLIYLITNGIGWTQLYRLPGQWMQGIQSISFQFLWCLQPASVFATFGIESHWAALARFLFLIARYPCPTNLPQCLGRARSWSVVHALWSKTTKIFQSGSSFLAKNRISPVLVLSSLSQKYGRKCHGAGQIQRPGCRNCVVRNNSIKVNLKRGQRGWARMRGCKDTGREGRQSIL